MKNPISVLFFNLTGNRLPVNGSQTAKTSPFFMTLVEKLLQGPRQLLQRFPMVRNEILPNPGLGLSGRIGFVDGSQTSTESTVTGSELQIQPPAGELVKISNPQQALLTESLTSETSSEVQTSNTEEKPLSADSDIPIVVQSVAEPEIIVDSSIVNEAGPIDPVVAAEVQPSPSVIPPDAAEVLTNSPNVAAVEGESNPGSAARLTAESTPIASTPLTLLNNPVTPTGVSPEAVNSGSGLEKQPNQPSTTPNLTVAENTIQVKAPAEAPNPTQIRFSFQNESKPVLDSLVEEHLIPNQPDQNPPEGQPHVPKPLNSQVNHYGSTPSVKIVSSETTDGRVLQPGQQSEQSNSEIRVERGTIRSPLASNLSATESLPPSKTSIESQNRSEIHPSTGGEERLIFRTPAVRKIVEIQTDSNAQKGQVPEPTPNSTPVNRLTVTARIDNPVTTPSSNSTVAKTANPVPDISGDSPRASVNSVVKENVSSESLPNNQSVISEPKSTSVRDQASRPTSVNLEIASKQDSPSQESEEKPQGEIGGKSPNPESFNAKPKISYPGTQAPQRLAPTEEKNHIVESTQNPTSAAKQIKKAQSAPKLTPIDPAAPSTAGKPKGNLERLAPELTETTVVRNTTMNQDNIYPVDRAFRLALVNRITQLIEQSHQKNSREMTFRIQANDNELLELRFIKDAQSNRGRIVTGSEVLAESIQRQMPIIVQNLESKGIHFAELSVYLSNPENFSGQTRSQANRSSNSKVHQTRSDNEAVLEEPVKKTYYLGYNTIDYVA